MTEPTEPTELERTLADPGNHDAAKFIQRTNFMQVIKALEQGKMAHRVDWLIHGKFIFRQVPSTVPLDIIPRMSSLPSDVKMHFIKSGKPIHYSNQFAMVHDNNISGWTPSIPDVLAEDWCIIDSEDPCDYDITSAPVTATAGTALTISLP